MKLSALAFLTLVLICPSMAFAHGGGCRQADKPLCCHMDNSTGTVHCH